MNGIDIYNGSEIADWDAIKSSGVQYVYLKATEGLTFNDSKMKEFYNGAKSVGLKVGFYHFLHRNNPYMEAQHFINMISSFKADMKYMIDVEAQEFSNAGQNDTSTRVRQFYDYMQSKGYECAVYTYSSFYKELFDDRVKSLPLWLAEYGVKKPSVTQYIGWQYAEDGNVPGVNGKCDVNNFSEGILLGNSKPLILNVSEVAAPQNIDNTTKIIQQQLNTLLKLNLVVDGIKGTNTDNAIKEFQGIMGLVQDGIWGQNTVTAVTQIFNNPVDGIQYPHYEYATRYIQYRVGGSIDGVFGNGTKVNVQNWQARHGLSADGVVGGATWNELINKNN
ncbi:GH25 family lysozyme [Clostridium felsineum]|uniref:GH25 family lysozyme n=1 Tax=Clostridium felsineum TaxID=36839 RepID=UPI00098CE97E|nr:GH25 family lysozyme [Clostridium felsineum]URZ15343.1 Autolytic lysozyme [Clostridium felsineum DSM 794]